MRRSQWCPSPIGTPDVYAFKAEWFDQIACRTKVFVLRAYSDDTIDLFDEANRRLFLRRTKVPRVVRSDLSVGRTVDVGGRDLRIIDYADKRTAWTLVPANVTTCGLIKPSATLHLGQILDCITEFGLKISNLRMVEMDKERILEFYPEFQGKPESVDLVNYLSSGTVVGLEVKGPDAVNAWKCSVGPTDPSDAKKENPNSLRALFGTDTLRNGFHASADEDAALRELNMMFYVDKNHRPVSTSKLSDCTMCLIKPHAIKEGLLGRIIMYIQTYGFNVAAAEMFQLNKQQAENFYSIYRGVMVDYLEMVSELYSGPCVALEIDGKSDVVDLFREFAGPIDPTVACNLRPQSLRATFGSTIIKNAVHCTDLNTDGVNECRFFQELP